MRKAGQYLNKIVTTETQTVPGGMISTSSCTYASQRIRPKKAAGLALGFYIL